MDELHLELGGRDSGSCGLEVREGCDVHGWLGRDRELAGVGRFDLGVGERLGDRLGAHVAPRGDGPLVVLFGEQGADETDDGGAVGEDADDVGAAADLLVQPLERVVIPYERRRMPAVTLDRLDAGGVRVGEYGATVRDGGIWEQTQVGQAVLVRWASSPC
jgi:hypothetical protein